MTSALAPTGPASADVDAGVGPGVRPLAWLLLLGGVTGLLAAATLLVEKIALIDCLSGAGFRRIEVASFVSPK